MNFGRTDLLIITSMSLAVVLMSFAMPALGLTDESDEAEESDLPEFDMNASRFDFAGDFPDSPNPSEGTLELDFGEDLVENPDQRDFLHGDTDAGVSITLLTTDKENATIHMTQHDVAHTDVLTINETDTRKQLENDTAGYNVHYILTDVTNSGTDNVTMTVDYEIIERPEDQSFLGGIPLIGSLLSTGELLAQTVMWVGSVIFWFFGAGIEVSLNVLGMFFDVATYGVDLMSFMIDTWQSILSAASGFAAVFILIPVVLLFLEFIKIIMIGISLLPFT